MTRSHTHALTLLSTALLSGALAAQTTWVVDPSGAGNFTTLAAAHAGAMPGDTLLLVGAMNGTTLTKRLNVVAHQAIVYGPLVVQSPGPVSISGGQFGQVVADGTNTSLDGVSANVVVTGSATLSARDCAIQPGAGSDGAATIDAGSRGVFDGCTIQGRDTYAVFGVILGTAAATIRGHAELNDCVLIGGATVQGPLHPFYGGPAIDLAGTVDLRRCQLSSGQGLVLVRGTGLVRHEQTFVGAPNVTAGVTTVAASLPWMTGMSAAPGGALQVGVDGPATTLATISASLGMHAPVPTPIGDVWLTAGFVPITAGVTDGSGGLATSVFVPPVVTRGLLVTFQGVVIPPSGGLRATAPAVLHVN